MKKFILAHHEARRRAMAAVADAEPGYVVTITPPKRTSEMNAKFHAMCADLARTGTQWAGKKRSAQEWKVLLISGHATVTKEGAEVVPGLEGEFVSIRESSALMSVRRGASLIDYAQAFGDEIGVAWSQEETQ